MSQQKITKFIFLILSRAIIFYLALFIISYWIIDHKRLNFSIKVKMINHLMPGSFEPLLKSVEGKREVDVKKVWPYILFYEKIVDSFPDRADAYSMLGFCYFYIKEHEKSINAYKKSLEGDENNFWFNYNLGLIYYKQGKYKEAIAHLEKSVAVDPKKALEYVLSSKIVYRSIIMEMDNPNDELNNRLLRGYQNAYLLLVLSHYQLQDFPRGFEYAMAGIKRKLGKEDVFYYYAGLAVYKKEEYQKATLLFQASVDRNANYADAVYHGALSLRALGKEKQAESVLAIAENIRKSGKAFHFNENDIFVFMF